MRLLDRRVLFVTGKGGVGKTTVACALALAAARTGRRVALAETQGSSRVPGIFDRPKRGYALQEVYPKVSTLSITSEEAIEDYVLQQLKVRALYKLVFQNRVMAPFIRGVPGLHDLVQVGKVWDLERQLHRGSPEWDLIVVDAPATGHGLSMLRSPQTMMDLTVAGPFYENARLLRDLVHDPERTGLVLVSLPEEMPVNETLDLYARLGDLQPQVALCVLNEIHPNPIQDLDRWRRVRAAVSAHQGLAEVADFADRAAARAEAQRQARARLSAALPCPMKQLPFLFQRDLRTRQLEELADLLEVA